MDKLVNVIIIYVLPIIFIAVMLYYNFAAYSALNEQAKLKSNGQITKAKVTDLEHIESTKGADSYFLEYDFKIDGEKLNNRTKVDAQTYQTHRKGSSIKIVYLEKNPKINNIPGNAAPGGKLIFALILDAVVIGFLIMIYFKYRQ